MNIDVVKGMDPYHTHVLLLLERIAKAVEKIVEEDNDRKV